VLAAWLGSEDFDAARLAPLKKYGQAVVPSLVSALVTGPSPAHREAARRSLERQYDRLAKYAQDGGRFQLRSKPDFVEYYMGNLGTLYRIRAAQALGAIGGPEAKTALAAAAGKAGREDLRKEVQRALEGIK
jgi:HEAT repeat protein